MNNKIYAYCRVSTQRQDLQRQIDNITKLYPSAVIYSDKFTGATTDRPNWNKLHKILTAGDTVVFDSVSRMSRNAAEGITIQYGLEKGAKLTTKKSISAKEIIKQHNKDFGGSLNDHDTATLAGISRNTYYKYKAELKAELNK